MSRYGSSLKRAGAVAAMVFAVSACGGSNGGEANEVSAASTVDSASATSQPAAAPETTAADPVVSTTGVTTDPAPAEPPPCGEVQSSGPLGSSGVVATFENEVGENADGIAVDAAGNAYLSFAPRGEVVRLMPDSADYEVVGTIPGWDDPFPGIGGVALDATGNLYVAVAGGGTSGVWRLECATGDPTRIAGTETIGLPNSLAFDDVGNLYVTDSNSGVADDQAPLGAVWRITPSGEVDRWAEDVLLGGTGEMGIGPIGANGLSISGDEVYVAVTEKAAVVTLEILEDGASGPATVFAEGDALAIIEGIAAAPTGEVFAAVASTNSIVSVSLDGEVTTVAVGMEGDIDQPANLILVDDPALEAVLYVTNNARFSNLPDGVGPSVVALPIGQGS